MARRRRTRTRRNGVRVYHEGRIELDGKRAGEVLREAIVEEIVRNADEGQDRHGRPLPAYDPEYALDRAEHGLSNKPNLRRTGKLLASIRGRIRVSKRSGNVKVTVQPTPRQRPKARGLVGRGYDIFGLSRRAAGRVVDALVRANRVLVSRRR